MRQSGDTAEVSLADARWQVRHLLSGRLNAGRGTMGLGIGLNLLITVPQFSCQCAEWDALDSLRGQR